MEEAAFSVADILAIIKRRMLSLVLPFTIIAAAAGATALLLPPVYRSTATILIEQREIPAEYVTSSITTFAEQRMQSIQQRILTASSLLELIEKFNLYESLKKKKTREEIIKEMRDDITLEPVNVEIADRRSGRTATATIAFTLSYDGDTPKKTQQVAGTISSLFLKEDMKVRKEQAASAHDFLEVEKERLQDQINALEKKIAVFKEKNVDALPDLLQLNRRNLNDLELQIDRAKENLRSLKEKKEELEDTLINTEEYLPENRFQKDQDEQRLEMLKMELINLKTLFSDKYPDVINIKQEIQELTLKVKADAENRESDLQKNPAFVTLSARLAGLISDIQSVHIQIKDLEDEVRIYRNRLSMTPAVEEKYNTLMAQRQTVYLKFNELQAKLMEARVAQEFESKQKGERFLLVEPARLPEKPVKPNRIAIALIGLVLGTGAGIGLAALKEFTDSSFRTAEALAKASGLPVLTEIPVIMTRADKRKKYLKILAAATAVILIFCTAAFLFDQFVMDFDVLQAKLMRKLS